MSVYRRGDNYYYDFQLDRHRFTRRVGPSREIAVEAERQARAEALVQRYQREWGVAPRRARAKTVQQFFDDDYAPQIRNNLAPKTVKDICHFLGTFCDSYGSWPVRQVTPRHFEDHKTRRLQTVNANSLRTEFGWLRAFFEAARQAGYCAGNPARAVALPTVGPTPDRVISEEEERRFYQAVRRPRIRHMFQLLLWTGLRRSEIVALKWKHVDFEQEELLVYQPKAKRPKRLPLLGGALRLLKDLRPDSVNPEQHIFLNRYGRPLTPDALWQAFRAARTVAGLADVRLHDLRHTVATRLVRLGYDVPTIGAILGHKPPYRETARYFAHVSPARVRAALRDLQSLRTHNKPPTP